MKLITMAFLILCSVGGAFAAEDTSAQGGTCAASGDLKTQSDSRLAYCADGKWVYVGPSFEGALFTTQVLATATCRDKANLDPLILGRHSSAFVFLLAVRSLSENGILAADISPEVLAERLTHLTCDQAGILQMDLPAT